MQIRRLLSRQWIIITFLVIVAISVMIRLGIWQLDRLDQRRKFNVQVIEQINQAPLELNSDNIPANLKEMEYRTVIVYGKYDFSHEMALRNQVWNNQIGAHLLTPLLIQGMNQAIIIDRGWIPQDKYLAGNWSVFDEQSYSRVEGLIRLAQDKSGEGEDTDHTTIPSEFINSWNFVNINQIAKQLPYPLLQVYIEQSPGNDSQASLPYRIATVPELSEGPHLSYAIQWFSFAALLAILYPIYVRRETKKMESEGKLDLGDDVIK